MAEEQHNTIASYSWINKEFLIKVLEFHEEKSVVLHKFNIQFATSKGDNYVGAVFRSILEYSLDESSEIQTNSIIIKTPQDNADIKEITEEFNVFDRELQAYQYMLIESMNLLREINDPTVFAPR